MANLPSEKTNNPIGSTAPVDLEFNSALLDCVVNGDSPVQDRLGRTIDPIRRLANGLILPAVQYGIGQIVPSGQVDPPNNRYSVNQVFQYQGRAIRFIGTNSQLPYDLTQTFEPGVWGEASVNIFKIRSPANFSTTDGQTRITPLDGNSNEYFITDAEIYIDGSRQVQDVNFQITQNNHLDLIGFAFDGTERVEWVINSFVEVNSLIPVGTESVTVPTFADIALLNTDNYPGISRIYTRGYDSGVVGGAEFIRDDSATDFQGYAATTANGQTWRQVNKDEIYSDSIGADPTNTDDSAGSIELLNALAAASGNISRGVIQTGHYKINGTAVNIRATQGYSIGGMSYMSLLDASDATTEFNIIEEPSGSDPVEGLIISDIRARGSNVGNSYIANLSKWRNASNLSNFRFGEGAAGAWGVNGIRHNATWYASVENGLIRNLSGIGAHWESTSATDGVNGIRYSSVFFNGNSQNILTEASTASRNGVALFDGCTFERSKLLSNHHIRHYAVKYNGCYLEGNGQEITSGASDIQADRSDVVLDTCLIRGYSSAPSDSPLMDTSDAGVIHVKDGTAIATGGRPLFGDNAQYTLGYYNAIDHTRAYRDRYSPTHLGGAPFQLVKDFVPMSTARQTSMALSGTLTSFTGLRVIQTVDFATAAANEAFGFEVVVQDAFRGSEVRYGRQKWAVAVRKQDTSFFFDEIEVYNLSGADNAHAVVSFLYSGSQVSIRVDTANSGTSPELISWIVEPILAQLNDRFVIGAGF